MDLFYKNIGNGKPLIILHGLFGSGDNWITHAREFGEHFEVFLVDQRNHGHSPHHPQFNYDILAEDLLEFIAQRGLRDVTLLGHSMGGKTVLRFAQQNGFLIDRMIVADMGIKGYRPHHDSIFKGLFAVDVDNCPGRKEAEERLLPFVPESSTRQFLLKNLYWATPGKLAWRFNLQTLFEQNSVVIGGIPNERIDTPTLFLRGGKSHYVPPTDDDSIKAMVPHASFVTMPNAGHWLHADDPELFRKHVLEYLL
jgi:esterase